MKKMKKILATAMLAVSLFAVAFPALAATEYGKCNVGTYINVRKNPPGDMTPIYNLRNGQPVTTTGATSGNYKKISSPVTGWVDKNYLTTSTPAWMSSYGSKTMNLATKAQMEAFQKDLNKLPGISITVDGYWGSETETAVREAQRQAGITIDGIAGTMTKVWVYELSHRSK